MVGGGANQNVLGVTVGTTADVATEVGDCDDASASCARPVPSRHPVGVAYSHAPNHQQGMVDGALAAAVNDVSHDAQGEGYRGNNNHNYHGMAEEVDTIRKVDNSQVGMSLMNNSRVGRVDDGEVQQLDNPT